MIDVVDLGTENDERMVRLREALALSDGFQLVIVQVEPGEQREEVLRRFAEWSGRDSVPVLELVRLAPHESPVLTLGENRGGVILSGLETGGDDKEERICAMIAELNWNRDRLPELVHGPLILIVSQRVQITLFEQAPDLYSWRTHSMSITPRQRWIPRFSLWFDTDPEDPATLEARITATRSLRPTPEAELAWLQQRLGFARAVRGEFRNAESALDAAYGGYVHFGTIDNRVYLLLLRVNIDIVRSRFYEARVWLERARREAASGVLNRILAARLLLTSGILYIHHGDLSSAETELQRAAVAVQALDDYDELARLMCVQAVLAFHRGGPPTCIMLLQRALELYQRARDPLGEAGTLMLLASTMAETGRSDDAERDGVASVARAEVSGSANMVARARGALGQIALANGHLELAGEVLGREVTTTDPGALGWIAEARGQLAVCRGELTTAGSFLLVALEAYQLRGTRWSIANVSLELGKLGQRRQDAALATAGFDNARRFGDERQRAYAALGLAALDYDRGERTTSLADQLALATRMLLATGDAMLADVARQYRGTVLLALGRDLEARAELEAALAGFKARGQAEIATRVRGLLAQLEEKVRS